MTDTIYRILWIVGTMAGALIGGLMLLQFVIWLMGGGVSDDENNRPLFGREYKHRKAKLPDEIVMHVDNRLPREQVHEQIRQKYGYYTEEQTKRRADKHAEQIVEQLEQE